MPFEDVAAETAVLAGQFRHGRDAHVDCSDLVDPSHFTVEHNQHLQACFAAFYEGGSDRRMDYPSLLSTARRLGLEGVFEQAEMKRQVKALMAFPVELATVRPEAAKLRKLRVAKELYEVHRAAAKRIAKVDGGESLEEILSLAESPIFEYTSSLSQGADTGLLADGIDEWLDNVLAHPVDNLGIPTPFPLYNRLTGGGPRRGGITVVAARPKAGKSTFVANVAVHVAGTLGFPVLDLDTEMNREGNWPRVLARLSGVDSELIARGRLSRDQEREVRRAKDRLKAMPFHYRSVIDETFEEQVAMIRRWAVKDVGVDADGRRNDCLVLYDYLQLTDPREFGGNKFQEYQILGFQMVALARLAKRYDIPILSTLQLNKDGWASGSDRIVWKCESFAKLRRKTADEMGAGDGEGNGALEVVASRYAPGTEAGDWINMDLDFATSTMTEGRLQSEADRGKKPSRERGFEVEDDDDE